MSDAAAPRTWRFYVEDMIAFCDKALAYNQGLDRSAFGTDRMRYDATLRSLDDQALRRTRTASLKTRSTSSESSQPTQPSVMLWP